MGLAWHKAREGAHAWLAARLGARVWPPTNRAPSPSLSPPSTPPCPQSSFYQPALFGHQPAAPALPPALFSHQPTAPAPAPAPLARLPSLGLATPAVALPVQMDAVGTMPGWPRLPY